MQNKLSQRLKELRAETDLSQAKLATIFGMPQQTYNSWEQGQSQPDADRIIQIATYYDITTDYLLGKSNDKFMGGRRHKDDEIVATVSISKSKNVKVNGVSMKNK